MFCTSTYVLFLKFIYFWLRWVFVAAHGLSLVAVRGSYSLLWCTGFSLRWLLLFQSMGSRCTGFSTCGTRAQQLWCTGLAALRHVGSSRTRAGTHVPCIGRQILNHCATREVDILSFTSKSFVTDLQPWTILNPWGACFLYELMQAHLFLDNRGVCVSLKMQNVLC